MGLYMSNDIKMLIILFTSPFITFAIHIALIRIFRNSPPLGMALNSAILGYFPTVFLLWSFVFYNISSKFELVAAIFYCFIVYSSFAYIYFNFFVLSETARRIRILHEIYKAGSLSQKDIIDLYKLSDIINIRLKRLVEMKQLSCENGYYSIDGKILYWPAFFISLWRNILGFERGQKAINEDT